VSGQPRGCFSAIILAFLSTTKFLLLHLLEDFEIFAAVLLRISFFRELTQSRYVRIRVTTDVASYPGSNYYYNYSNFYVVKIVHWCNEIVIRGVFLDGCSAAFKSHGPGKRAAAVGAVEFGKKNKHRR
jgi:hypothetical protein